MTIEEIFERHARRIRDIKPATAEEIAELERLLGRTLPGSSERTTGGPAVARAICVSFKPTS